MKVVDIADEIFRELDSPSSLSIPAIAYWLRANIGTLNNYINTSYVINSTSLEIEQTTTDISQTATTAEIGEQEKAILKKMYMIHYYDTKLRSSLIAMDTDTVIEVSDQGSSVRKLNKNEITKTLNFTRNGEYQTLMTLVNAYKLGQSAPLQIAGDDTVAAYFATSNTINRTSSSSTV